MSSVLASEYVLTFKQALQDLFSATELRSMYRQMLEKRRDLTSNESLFLDQIELNSADLDFLNDCVARLLKGEPFQYVLGETFFGDLRIYCDARALIPRPETAELVQWIGSFLADQAYAQVLDIGTGSGCIALELKNKWPHLHVSGIDLSHEAIDLAKKNAKENNLQVEFQQQDVLATWDKEMFQAYDCWVSNPPYIPTMDKVEMHSNVLDFEPHMALFVEDQDPLLFYREIAQKARLHLKKSGLLFFEIHERYAQDMLDLLLALGFNNIELKEDLQGKPRMLKATN